MTVAELCRALIAHLIEQNTPMKGIPLLAKAISKLQLYDSQLTSIHADMCQLCLLAKCFKPALEILDVDITGICQEVSFLSAFISDIILSSIILDTTKSKWFSL